MRSMGVASTVTIFPRDPDHRLVQDDLAAFLDRVAERLVALGHGAAARVRAGRFEAEVYDLLDLLDTVNAARERSQGREDLEIRLHGDVHDGLAKYLGTPRAEAKFQAFVRPRVLLDARLCGGCGWPLDWDGYARTATCSRPSCGEGEPRRGELRTCWWLRFFGSGPEGIGERFVEESRRFEGSRFFESLEGVSRTPLFEWHAWG